MKDNAKKVRIPKPGKPDRPGIPALEWLGDVSGRTARVTAIGSRRVLIENHTGIQDFTCDLIRLSTAAGPLCVRGDGLSLCDVRSNALIVHGCIRSVDLPEGGGDE